MKPAFLGLGLSPTLIVFLVNSGFSMTLIIPAGIRVLHSNSVVYSCSPGPLASLDTIILFISLSLRIDIGHAYYIFTLHVRYGRRLGPQREWSLYRKSDHWHLETWSFVYYLHAPNCRTRCPHRLANVPLLVHRPCLIYSLVCQHHP